MASDAAGRPRGRITAQLDYERKNHYGRQAGDHSPWRTALYLAGTCVSILEHFGGRGERLRLERQLGALPKVDVLHGTAPSGTIFRAMLKIVHPALERCLLLVQNHITTSEASYWRHIDPILHALCTILPNRPGRMPEIRKRHDSLSSG